MPPHSWPPHSSASRIALAAQEGDDPPPLQPQTRPEPGSARRVAWPAREGDDLADVVQARGEQDEALKAEAKAAVRHAAVLAQVQVSLVRHHVHARLLEPALQGLQVVLTLAAANQLTHLARTHAQAGRQAEQSGG